MSSPIASDKEAANAIDKLMYELKIGGRKTVLTSELYRCLDILTKAHRLHLDQHFFAVLPKDHVTQIN
jgi:hypothetical protein